MRPVIIGVLAMTGCLRDPVFGQHGVDAATDASDLVGCPIPLEVPAPADEVVAAVEPFGAGIHGPGYGLNFGAMANSFSAYPSSITIGTTQVLDNSGAPCDEPNLMGVTFEPGGHVSADTLATMLEVKLQSPLVGQITSTWAKSYTCGNIATTRGETTFTAFPDGRIVRYDRLSHEGMVDAATCNGNSCAPTAGFVVGAYTRFARSPDLGSQANCVEHDLTARTAIAMDGTMNDAIPLRTSEGQTFSFFEWLIQGGGPLPSGDLGTVVTTMYLSSTKTCPELSARLGLDYPVLNVEPPDLLIEGVSTPMSSADGIYRAGAVDGTFHAASRLTIRPGNRRTGDGFAVELDLGPYTELNVVRSRCVMDEWYGVQLEPNGYSLLWFSGGLALDETITIDIKR